MLTLIGAGGGVRLGLWQLDRAAEKQTMLDQFAQGQSRTLNVQGDDAARLERYQRVHIEGQYDAEHQVLLDNMPSAAGRAGFRVLTPLKFGNEQWLLVDRGWIPLGAERTQLPDVTMSAQPGAVTGRIDDLPQPGMRMGENPVLSVDASWPRILNYPRHAELERALQRKLQPRVLLLDAVEPQGYERAWGANFGVGPTRHFAYAVQWFAMAFAMVCVFVVISFKASKVQ